MTTRDFANDLSELERELELQMDDDTDTSGGPTESLEVVTDDLGDIGRELDEELDDDSASVDDDASYDGTDYADRFYELAQRQFESESELDEPVNELLGEMEREFFWKGIGKRLRKAAKGGLGKLVKKGVSLARRHVPALQALKGITQLARGDLKGLLGALAKAGLASAVPGGAAVLPALGAIGFEAGEDADRAAWQNYTRVAQEAFEHLAQNITENADHPIEASQQATTALQSGLRAARGRGRTSGRGRRRRVQLRRGDILEIHVA
jgi:hypothetical protein